MRNKFRGIKTLTVLSYKCCECERRQVIELEGGAQQDPFR